MDELHDIKCQPEPFLPPFELARQVHDGHSHPLRCYRIQHYAAVVAWARARVRAKHSFTTLPLPGRGGCAKKAGATRLKHGSLPFRR